MNDAQAIIGAMFPTVAVLIGILVNNSRLSDLRHAMDKRFDDTNVRFADVNRRFDDVNRRIDEVKLQFADVNRRIDESRAEMRDLIRLSSATHDANLHRVEEVIDARLKHLEERAA